MSKAAGMGCSKGKIALPGKSVGGFSSKVHGKTMTHTKFALPHEKAEGQEIFHNEKKHSSTEKLEHKHFAHIK